MSLPVDRIPPRKIDEEIVSVDSLMHVLESCCGCSEVAIHREINDPPDFTIAINGKTFPTEITSITWHQDYDAQLRRLERLIASRATELGILDSMVVLICSRFPQIPKPTSTDGRCLIETACQFLRSIQRSTEIETLVLIEGSSGEMSITRFPNSSPSLCHCWTPPALWEGEVEIELASILQHVIEEKTRKLRRVGITAGNSILVLYDAFGYAEPALADRVLAMIEGYQWFHSIFWAASFTSRKNNLAPKEPGREGMFLFSVNDSWDNRSSVMTD